MAAPVTPFALVLSKALAGAAFGVTLALLYAPALYAMGIDGIRWGPYLLVAIVSAFCFSLFGLLMALPFRDIPQAMPPATVVRIVLVFISGAFSAPGGAETIWRKAAYGMPLVCAVDGFRHAIDETPPLHALGVDLLGLAGLASLYAAIAVLSFRRQRN